MKIILGSQSPRRKEILNYFSLPFKQVPSHFDEETILFTGNPHEYALELSQKKAESLEKEFSQEIIVTADTVVFCEGKIYNKPYNKDEAISFLSELSGKWHEVFTAVTVRQGSKIFSDCEKTRILFHPLSPEHINQYLTHFAYSDKAGGYAIQQGGSIIVSKIEGCYYNVMGLPINTLQKLLMKFGIDLWNYLKIF